MTRRKTKRELIDEINRQNKRECISFRRWKVFSQLVKEFKRELKDEIYLLERGSKIDERDEELLKALNKLISQVQEITDDGYAAYSKPHEGRHWSFSHLC